MVLNKTRPDFLAENNTNHPRYLTVEQAIEEVSRGKMIILYDREDRENEGDLYIAARFASPEALHFMAREGAGLLCQALCKEQADRLGLNPMVQENSSSHQTAFTVSVDAREGTSTGISAQDRSRTARVLINPQSLPEDLLRPGHLFPLIAHPGGLLSRQGHTEAAVELARLAGLEASGLICEILKEDGSMARSKDLEKLAERWNLGLLGVEALKAYLEDQYQTLLQSDYGTFNLRVYPGLETKSQHEASGPLAMAGANDDDFTLSLGSPETSQDAVLLRIHSECLTGEVLHSQRCDCGYQLDESLKRIAQEGRGLLIYLRQEGRGIGLVQKIRAYHLQDEGLDTLDANLKLGLPADARDYSKALAILKRLGIRKVRLLSNNPEKLRALEEGGIEVCEQIPLKTQAGPFNKKYLETKKIRFGHQL